MPPKVVKKAKKVVSSKKETQKAVRQVRRFTPVVAQQAAAKKIHQGVSALPKRFQPVAKSELARLSKVRKPKVTIR